MAPADCSPLPELRTAEPADEAFLERLYASTRERDTAAWGWPAETLAEFLRLQSRAQRLDLRRRFPRSAESVVEIGGAPAGRIWVDRAGETIELLDLSLLPEHRGRGLGGRLLADLLAEAEAAGKPVRLRVETSNPARRLYERSGFAWLGDDGVYGTMRWSPPASAPGVS